MDGVRRRPRIRVDAPHRASLRSRSAASGIVERTPVHLRRSLEVTCGAGSDPLPNRGQLQEVVMAAQGIVAVVGSRQLPSSFASHVSSLVGFFVERGLLGRRPFSKKYYILVISGLRESVIVPLG